MANRRKVSSSSLAVSGTLTRSKSDLFIHRTRSGQARPDRKRHHHQPKDLRSKRVFSRIDDRRSESEDSEISKRSTDDSRETAPQDIDIASEFDGGKGIRVLDETNLGNLSEYNLRSTDDLRETTPPDLDVESELDGGKGVRVSEERNFGNLSENILGLSACSRSKVIGNPSSNSYRRLLPYLKNLVEDGSSGIQILQSHGLSPKTDKNVLPNIKVVSKLDGGKSVSEEANLGNSFENKQGHFPWSRPKLIVNPSSVSYKRLLPYIKDLDKEGSSDIKILQSYDHLVKVEKTMNGTTTVTSDPSYEEQNNVTPLGDTSMVYSGGNCGLVGNPVLGNLITDSHEKIVQNSTRKEPPIHEVTGEVRFTEDSMDELNGQEQKGTNKERCRFDAENLNVPAECSEEPNSISYKRLLPCIMDLDKEGSSDIKILQSYDHSVKVEKTMNGTTTLLSDPSYEEQNNVTPLGDSCMVYSGGNCGLVGNPVLGNLITNSHEEIVQNSTRKEPPIHEVTGEVRFTEDSMDELNGQEQKGANKERCRFDAENLNVPAECSEEPNSISYKRLLPCIMDLDKEGSSDIKILQSYDHSVKVEKTMNGTTTLLFDPSYEEQNNVTPLGDSCMVYSGGNCGLVGNPVLGNLITNSHEEIVQNSTRKEPPIHEVTGEVRFTEDSMDELNGQEQKGTNKERCRFDAENLNVPAECSEEVAQSTPPDVDLIRKLDGAENGSRRTLSESELNNASKRNSGLGLCSRSKLYRNPSSFSYRRLLPYLTDLEKNAPSGLEIIQSHSLTAKVDNIMEESTPVLNEVTSPRQQCHTIPPADFSPVYLRENQDFKTKYVSESCVLDSQDDIHNCKATELPNVCNKNEDQVFGIMSQISPEALDSEFEMLCKSSSCTPTISEDLSFEELAGGMMRETDRNHTKKVSRFENFSHGVNRALAPRKSILKKQSRGCIGICMCLDCVSFRVHAERAYEFSRRQMLGADEVVERLMKELSCLRNVMERSQVPVVDGDGERILVNQEQVKKVCKRALCVEEQAKLRMKQLFCDLRTHCKIPGPRVSFSETVDERIIL